VIIRSTPTPGSNPGDDVGDQIGTNPANRPIVDIRHLKQGGDARVSGATVHMNDVGHPPIIGLGAATDHCHPSFHAEKDRWHGDRAGQRMISRHD
jgi:hypothetical protein